MRRFALRVDQLPAWAFVGVAILLFGFARAGRLFALLHQSRGGMELGGIATFTAFLGVVIFAVRRRQARAWQSTLHVLVALVAGNALALLFIWPLIPEAYDISMAPLMWETLTAGATISVLSLPLAIALLWLSRRYGSHSAVTERRGRVIREVLRRRMLRNQALGTPAPDTPVSTPVAVPAAAPDP
jgi:uncharacterized membrane protein